MTDSTETPLDKRAQILGELWLRYSNDDTFADFMTYNDLGLPLAYALSTDIISSNPRVEAFVNETWDLFMQALEREDEGFDTLDDIIIPEEG